MAARQINPYHQSVTALQTSRGSWFDLLIRFFAKELLAQIQQGIHQDYIRREAFLPYIRGRWNIGGQFVHKPNLLEGLDVSFDDYLPDTLLNRVFRYVIAELQRVTRDPQNRQMLADLQAWLYSVELPARIEPSELEQVQFNRLNERFAKAFELARLLLENKTTALQIGKQRAYAFLLDMDRLFEKFVAAILQRYSRSILPESWQHLSVELQGGKEKQYLIELPNQPENPLVPLKPDILLKSSTHTTLIIDTKNKELPQEKPYQGVSEGDMYQMLAYATCFQCPNVLLLYPRVRGASDQPFELRFAQSSTRLFIATLDLHQPLHRLDQLIENLRAIFRFIEQKTTTR